MNWTNINPGPAEALEVSYIALDGKPITTRSPLAAQAVGPTVRKFPWLYASQNPSILMTKRNSCQALESRQLRTEGCTGVITCIGTGHYTIRSLCWLFTRNGLHNSLSHEPHSSFGPNHAYTTEATCQSWAGQGRRIRHKGYYFYIQQLGSFNSGDAHFGSVTRDKIQQSSRCRVKKPMRQLDQGPACHRNTQEERCYRICE